MATVQWTGGDPSDTQTWTNYEKAISEIYPDGIRAKACQPPRIYEVEAATGQAHCKLDNNWVQYCFDPNYIHGLRRCNSYEAEDVIVRPGCTAPNHFAKYNHPAPLRCVDGKWVEVFGCNTGCKLDSLNPSVRYKCLSSDNATRDCNFYEPAGTVVRAECKEPTFSSSIPLPPMKCTNGTWDNVATCPIECGTVAAEGERRDDNWERPAVRGELPWHASIYTKTITPHLQVCGGSLISTSVVISAAHCFWSEDKQHPASNYAVAVGKLYRSWDDERDVEAQISDVQAIHSAIGVKDYETSLENDLAVLVMATAFQYTAHVRPVCLNFNVDFERDQLHTTTGKAASWGLTTDNDDYYPMLKVTEYQYIDRYLCYDVLPDGFKEYITSDKICAKQTNNGTALCRGGSGSGLVFPEMDYGIHRYHLRGVASTAPGNGKQCNLTPVHAFARITNHENLIKMYL